jgi:hypothetical protein
VSALRAVGFGYHIQLMTASMVHVTNLIPPGSNNPSRCVWSKAAVDDGQYGPRNQSQSDTPRVDECGPTQRCGGCTWQDVSYPAQLRFKREQVLDVMTRIAKVGKYLSTVLPITRETVLPIKWKPFYL